MKQRIRQLAHIRTGYQFRGKVEPMENANVLFIQMKDVSDDLKVEFNDLTPVHLDKPEPYEVHEGDVLFLPRGQSRYALAINQPVENIVASSVYFILTPASGVISSDYLAWTLNQSSFQNLVDSFAQGTTTKLISKSDFSNLKIDVPPLEVQHHILEFQKLQAREHQLITQIQDKRNLIIQSISRQLATGQLKLKDNSK